MPAARPSRVDIPTQILDEATRLFAAHGFDGVSLADIAKVVGIRKPSLLYHFHSKDTLRRAVLENLLARWNDVLPKLLMAATSGSEQFEAVVSKTLAFFVEDRDRARLILRELLDRPAELQPLIETHVRPWATLVADYIRRGQEQGRLHLDVDPEAYVAHVTMLVLSSLATFEVVATLAPKGSADQRTLLERHTRELLRIARTSLFRPRKTDAQSETPAESPAESTPEPAPEARAANE